MHWQTFPAERRLYNEKRLPAIRLIKVDFNEFKKKIKCCVDKSKTGLNGEHNWPDYQNDDKDDRQID